MILRKSIPCFAAFYFDLVVPVSEMLNAGAAAAVPVTFSNQPRSGKILSPTDRFATTV